MLTEINRCLAAHGLIKVRLYGIERDLRDALITEVCQALDCANVQHIGNLLVLWRPQLDSEHADGKSTPVGRRPAGAKPATKKQAAAAADSRARARPASPRRRARPAP